MRRRETLRRLAWVGTAAVAGCLGTGGGDCTATPKTDSWPSVLNREPFVLRNDDDTAHRLSVDLKRGCRTVRTADVDLAASTELPRAVAPDSHVLSEAVWRPHELDAVVSLDGRPPVRRGLDGFLRDCSDEFRVVVDPAGDLRFGLRPLSADDGRRFHVSNVETTAFHPDWRLLVDGSIDPARVIRFADVPAAAKPAVRGALDDGGYAGRGPVPGAVRRLVERYEGVSFEGEHETYPLTLETELPGGPMSFEAGFESRTVAPDDPARLQLGVRAGADLTVSTGVMPVFGVPTAERTTGDHWVLFTADGYESAGVDLSRRCRSYEVPMRGRELELDAGSWFRATYRLGTDTVRVLVPGTYVLQGIVDYAPDGEAGRLLLYRVRFTLETGG